MIQSNGYLSPGEVKVDIDDFFNFFVTDLQFRTSKKRVLHFQEFLRFLKKVNDLDLVDGISYIVVDGSYCSGKKEPDDMDIFLYYDVASDAQVALEFQIDLNKRKLKNDGIDILSFHDFTRVPSIKLDLTKQRLDLVTRQRFESYYSVSKDNVPKGHVVISKEDLMIRREQDVVSTIA